VTTPCVGRGRCLRHDLRDGLFGDAGADTLEGGTEEDVLADGYRDTEADTLIGEDRNGC